ncbi:MAG: VTT domain-containing protein [Chitinophagaceae bacterium]
MIRFRIIVLLQNIFEIFDAESLIRNGGLLVALLIVYGTTGLFFCFFLPTGAVLFATGVFVATGGLHYSMFSVCSLLILASVLGNITGYWFGRKTGPLLYNREDSRFFRKQHLKTAEAFYNKYGWLALTAGLFLPIIRTFASIAAGIIRLDFRRFLLLTFTGSVIWILSFVSAGYFIGSRPFLKSYLKYAVPAFVLVVTLPLIVKMIKELKKLRKENEHKE